MCLTCPLSSRCSMSATPSRSLFSWNSCSTAPSSATACDSSSRRFHAAPSALADRHSRCSTCWRLQQQRQGSNAGKENCWQVCHEGCVIFSAFAERHSRCSTCWRLQQHRQGSSNAVKQPLPSMSYRLCWFLDRSSSFSWVPSQYPCCTTRCCHAPSL
jgi:hypothetical protein